MLTVISKYRFWVILACLSAFFLSSATIVVSQRTNGRNSAGSGSIEIPCAFVTMDAPFVLTAAGERIRLQYSDTLVSVVPGQPPLVFDGGASPYPLHDGIVTVNNTTSSVTPIRAPPFRRT